MWVRSGKPAGLGSQADFVLIAPHPTHIGLTPPASSGQPSGPHPTVFDCRVPESAVFRSVFSGQFNT